jgi:hypothetical protein
LVLAGFELRTDVLRVRHPDRFRDARGVRMWKQVMELIAKRRSRPAVTEAAA